tara:strand:- start:505 stop:696 length:192 start_codon:yes stop_codon:yes gene_type:complete
VEALPAEAAAEVALAVLPKTDDWAEALPVSKEELLKELQEELLERLQEGLQEQVYSVQHSMHL